MIEIGRLQTLEILRFKAMGAFLGTGEEGEPGILLPRKYTTPEMKPGDKVEVFIYLDSEDRIIATTQKPHVMVGEIGVLKVVETGHLGAFLDWGLEKDLLIPHREQQDRPQKGRYCVVAVYLDKQNRPCATMYIEKYLTTEGAYSVDDKVWGTVYRISEAIGVLVAVENKYVGLIPRQEAIGHFKKGDRVECRIASVRDDGKLVLSLKEKAHIQMDVDANKLKEVLKVRGGFLDINDDSDPELIKRTLKMSKRAFKRAVGRLLKEGYITLTEKGIEQKQQQED